VPATSSAPGSITRVVVVWMENEEASAVTSSTMPYLYGLSIQYGRADEMYAIEHPSQPNYIGLWSGSTQGVTNDGTHDVDAESLSSQVTAAGKQWRVYAQNVPGDCFTKATHKGGADGPGVSGTYARKHEPAISFRSVSGSPAECAKIQPLAAFDPTAFAVAFVVPNLCNDAHDCSLAKGDAFLQAFLPSVFNSPEWPHTLLVVSFDEGTSDKHGGGNVFTVVARQGLSGVTSSTMHNHYDVLRTIEDLLGLPCLANACSATPLTEFLP
jgi:phosphatidylinositol-3-phosphatase